MKFTYFIGVILITTLIGCKVTRTTTTDAQPDILGGEWLMDSWAGYDDISKAFPTGLPRFVIDTKENVIRGFNGCNQIRGQLRYNRQTSFLQFFAISSTKMFCMSVPEDELSRTIALVNAYRVDTDQLKLLRDNELLMEFSRITEK